MTVLQDGDDYLVPVMTGRKKVRLGSRQAAGKRKAGLLLNVYRSVRIIQAGKPCRLVRVP